MRTISIHSIVTLAVLGVAACDDDSDGLTGPSSVVETVAVIPGTLALVAGDSLQLTTIARGKAGNLLVGHPVTWTVSGASATVSTAGVVHAITAGSAIISATVDGKVGTLPVTVSPRYASVAFASVAVGGAHSCALTSSGSVHCWGRAESGQLGITPPAFTCLGDQAIPCSLVPVPSSAGLAFAQLSGGSAHTCGLTIDGAAWCWGNNARGQLGDGSFTERAAPVAVASALKFESIDAGPEHTCALTSTGAAWCWGLNDRGQLGDSTTINRSVPVLVTGGLSLRAITAGGSFWGHTCGLTENDEAYCWGYNGIGQLGRGAADNVPHPTPGPVSGGMTFASLATGLGDQVCGLTGAGTAYCWGHNGRGALGDGSTTRSLLPVAVTGGLVFSRLATGGWGEGGHTCGLALDGAAWCWGDNEAGAVGDGTTIDRRAPTAVGGGLSFTSIDAGLRHTCARTTAGTVYCWGSGRTGQLGGNSVISSSTPVKVVGQQ